VIEPSRLALIERAAGSATHQVNLHNQILAMTGQIAAAAPAAATAAHVQDDVGAGMDQFSQLVQVYRPPGVAMICTIIGILGAFWWIAVAERFMTERAARIEDAKHILEDKRAEDAIAAEPMKAPREEVFDALTGERLAHVKPHWRKMKPKKGKPTQVDLPPSQMPPDEVGVPTGTGDERGALVAAAESLNDISKVRGNGGQEAADNELSKPDDENQSIHAAQPEPPIPDYEPNELEAAASFTADAVTASEQPADASEADANQQQSEEAPVEPEQHSSAADEPQIAEQAAEAEPIALPDESVTPPALPAPEKIAAE
jgi:hypothetical protein